MTIAKLKALIDTTHKHGLALKSESEWLREHRPFGWRAKVAAKTVWLRGLERLNARRRKELARKEAEQPKPDPKPTRFAMFDSITFEGVPPDPPAVAGYVDGRYENYGAMVKRYPKAKHLSIAVIPSNDADCLDIETGDATPSQAPAWVRKQHARGVRRPVVYANTSTMPAVLEALTKNGISRTQYKVWTAHYTDVAHVEPGSDATQWRNVETKTANYDESLCESSFL